MQTGSGRIGLSCHSGELHLHICVDKAETTLTADSLPFIDDNDCGLGIAVRTYLDDLPQNPEPTSPSVRAEIKAKGMEWFQHSNSFSGNLDVAFQLWDAVSIQGFSFCDFAI